LQKRQFYNNA